MLTHLNCPPIRANQLSMGYAAELAARFRCSSVYEFCSDFGISFRRLARGDEEELGRFAALTRNDLDNLRVHSTIHLPDGSIRLGHAVLAKHVLTRSTVRVCPTASRKISPRIRASLQTLPSFGGGTGLSAQLTPAQSTLVPCLWSHGSRHRACSGTPPWPSLICRANSTSFWQVPAVGNPMGCRITPSSASRAMGNLWRLSM